MVKQLIVTASSKSKRSEGEIPFFVPERSFIDSLNDKNIKNLIEARSELLKEFNFDKGPDTHSDLKVSSDPFFLPAYIRYSGRTFSKVTSDAWNNLNNKPDKFDCVILSAYYGIIRFNDPIRNYTIKQVTKMPSGKTIGKFWRDQGAQDWVFNYIKNNNINQVKFVLSTSYSDIIEKETLMERLEEELSIPSTDNQFKEGGGMRSMTLRGQYINNLLLDQVK
ncbi:MAG: hypothetical protein HeimC3_54510 [Candidatus Heimdallarchaeota archaeon LC_3]|nr:MAG: hypothetical protein HeimC3_54510 [Candidatus Heimdallarchaeota archaeon LC_3]